MVDERPEDGVGFSLSVFDVDKDEKFAFITSFDAVFVDAAAVAFVTFDLGIIGFSETRVGLAEVIVSSVVLIVSEEEEAERASAKDVVASAADGAACLAHCWCGRFAPRSGVVAKRLNLSRRVVPEGVLEISSSSSSSV